MLSLGCGAGVQALAERFNGKPVYAGLDTAFIGILEERGVSGGKMRRLRPMRAASVRRNLSDDPVRQEKC